MDLEYISRERDFSQFKPKVHFRMHNPLENLLFYQTNERVFPRDRSEKGFVVEREGKD